MKTTSRLIATILIYSFFLEILLLLPDTHVNAASWEDMPLIVTMGDSYSSGEGNEPFYDQDLEEGEKQNSQDWLAHRSEKAWAGLLTFDNGPARSQCRNMRNDRWFFVAASGAVTQDIPFSQKKTVSVGNKEVDKYLDPQIDVFINNDLKGKVDYVTLTLGGNDVGFTDVVTSAVIASMGGRLTINILEDALDKAWETFQTETCTDLERTYTYIHYCAGDQAKIIVVGYPPLINDKMSTKLFGKNQAEMLNAKIRDFNDGINGVVTNYHDNINPNIVFISIYKNFENHEAYTKTPYINGIMFLQSEDINRVETKDILHHEFGELISAYSIHPNEAGQKEIAKAVQKYINKDYSGHSFANLETEPTEEDIEQTWSREGDYIVFGHYEQDGDLSNGPEPIEWEIVREEDGKKLLVSRYILDCQPYNTEFKDVTWETCSLRSWLNDDFINTAFDAREQKQILTVTNTNPDNALYGTEGGNDTEDRVFCLSVEEVNDNYEFEKWYEANQDGYSQSLMTEVTQYAIDNGVWSHEYTSEDYTKRLKPLGYTDECIGLTCGNWWLRSPSDSNCYACCVNTYGGSGWLGTNVRTGVHGVRPALWLNLTPKSTNSDGSNRSWSREGDYIVFGHYEQDGDLSNGPEPIEWEIVREEDGRMLLVSRYILDYQPYNTVRTDVTWETCSLRSWLNDDFIKTAFDASEQKQILTVTNTNPDNARWETEGGNDTEDRVFCLSLEEILDNYDFEDWNEYYQHGYSQAIMAEVTQYAIDNGAWSDEITSIEYRRDLEKHGYTDECIGLTCSNWRLRSPGVHPDFADYIDSTGIVDTYGRCVDYSLGVRPALWLNLNS